MLRSFSLALAGALLTAGAALAGEVQINVNDVGRQRAPFALVEPDGTARVIWENTKLGIVSRTVPAGDPASASGAETLLLANTHVASVPGEGIVITNRQPLALGDGDGGFWLVWIRQRDYLKVEPFWESREVLSQEIRRQRFNRDGAPVGPASVVAWAGAEKSQATAVRTPDGGFVVAWSSNDGDDATYARDGVFARWFDRDGAPLGAAVRISAIEDAELAGWPSLSVDRAGKLLVLWHAPDGSSTGIFGRRFDENRMPLDEPQRLNLDPAGEQKRPSAVALDEGGYLVVWQAPRAGRLKTSVFVQRLDADGRPAGAERRLSSARHAHEMGPAIARTPRGTWFAAWVVWDSSFPREIRGIELASDGTGIGDELQLNDSPLNTQYRATLFGTPGTGLFAIWEGFVNRRAGINALPLGFLD